MVSLANSRNASTVSLPAQIKEHQATGYRRAVSLGPPAGVRNPMDVLSGILGVPVGVKGKRAEAKGVKELVLDLNAPLPELEDADGIEFGDMSLEEFVQAAEAAESTKSRSRQYNNRSIDECKLFPA